MNEMESKLNHKQRFFRDGAPYFKDFEMVVQELFSNSKSQNKAVAHATVDLMKAIQEHLADCHNLLGKTEKLVEEARIEKAPDDEIDKLISICLDIQNLQTKLSESASRCVNNFVDEIFPR